MARLGLIIAAALAFGPRLAAAEDVQYDIRVDGLVCEFCVATSERALRRIDGVRAVSSNLRAGIVSVCADESVVFTSDGLARLFLKKGFTYRSHTRTAPCTIGAREAGRDRRGARAPR